MGKSTIEDVIEIERRLYPDLWKKADEIAKIIAPGIWDDWYNGTGENAEHIPPSSGVKYERSSAIHRAWTILRYLEIAPQETDWPAIFKEMSRSRGPKNQAPTPRSER